MRMRALVRVGMVTVSSLVILPSLIGTAGAASPYQFGGWYTVSDVTAEEDGVHVTLDLKVNNYSGVSVTAGKVIVRSSDGRAGELGVFLNVSVLDGSQVELSKALVIPQKEYDLWEKGRTPNLRIQFDKAGHTIERRIELSPEENN